MRLKFAVQAVWLSFVLVVGALGWSIAGPAGALVENPPDMTVYLSSTTNGSVGGVTFGDEDVIAYDMATDSWSMVFDGSDVGLASADVDGFAVVSLDPFVIEMSFTAGRSVAGIGSVDDSDVVRFSGTGGENTSGGFLLVIDGSDIGLSTNNEDIDALGRSGSDFVFSTLGPFNVPGLTGDDEDLVSFSATSIGSGTAGVTSLLLDGSPIGLAPTDVVGVSVDQAGGVTYGATLTSFSIGGVSGDANDVFSFPTMNDPAMIVFDGDLHGFGAERIDGLHIGVGPGSTEPGSADLEVALEANTGSIAVGGVIEYTATVTNNGPDTAANALLDGNLPASLTLSAITGCAQNQQTLPCLIGSIESGQSEVLTVSALVGPSASGSVGFGVETSSAVTDPIAANNTASTLTNVVAAPVASDDGPADNSVPGDPFHIEQNATLTATDGSAEDLLNNDSLGDPAGALTRFGGGDLGGLVTDNQAGIPATFGVGGSLNLGADGSFSFTAPSGFTGPFSFDYRVENAFGSSDATVTIFVGARPSTTVYLSSTTSGVAGGIVFADEDIVSYDTATDTWAMVFDGSDLGLVTADIDGFHIASFDPLVIDLSLTAPRTLPGAGSTDDSDVVTFTGTGGPNTSGTFALLIDGSDLGLSSGGEDIDAVAMSGTSHLFSTIGNFNIPGGLLGGDEDLLSLIPTSTGSVTTGALSRLFDGSDVGFASSDLTAAWADPDSSDIYGAGQGNYTVGGINGDSDDVFAFSGTTGENTAGTAEIVFDGDLVGFGGEQIDGLHIVVTDTPVEP
ncbi:MAG: Ig-like domain-containing protein [Acidimicrobiales bacterium]